MMHLCVNATVREEILKIAFLYIRNPAATLRLLQMMLADVKLPDDIRAIQMRMQQTLYDMEQEESWKRHLSGEGNKQ